jgi:hypothetical protein
MQGWTLIVVQAVKDREKYFRNAEGEKMVYGSGN